MDEKSKFYFIPDDGKWRTLEEMNAFWNEQGCAPVTLELLYAHVDELTPTQLKLLMDICISYHLFAADLVYMDNRVSVNGKPPVECPVFHGVSIAEVLNTEVGLTLIRQFCGCQDDAKIILLKLKKLFGMDLDRFFFWTLHMEYRANNPHWAALLGYYDGGFHLCGYSIFIICRSFGVRETR